MQYSAKHLSRFRVSTSDGKHVGKVIGFLFDDSSLAVRHIVIRRFRWFGRKLLVDPKTLELAQGSEQRILLNLTKKQVGDSPEIEHDPPVHTLQEGADSERGPASPKEQQALLEQTDLRDTSEILGYSVKSSDGQAGKLDDVVLDTQDWKVSELVVRPRGAWSGTKVAIPPMWVANIDLATKTVRLKVDNTRLYAARRFDPKEPVNKTRETRTVDYAGQSQLRERVESR